MRVDFSRWAGAALLPLILLPSPALAHPGHFEAVSFWSGLLHPLTGFDHLAAMLMVGLWAGAAFRKSLIVPPLAFVTFMLGGFAYGALGGGLPLTEMVILASVIVLGLVLLFEVRLPLAAASGMIALFAFAHGYAHGSELPSGADMLSFAAGFSLTTIALHAIGIGIALRLTSPATRYVGAGVAAIGTALMFAT